MDQIRKVHYLKTWHQYYGAVSEGEKTFEIRKSDRDFRVGDFLVLLETKNDKYTGHWCIREISYILTSIQFEGIAEGYCALALYDPDRWYSDFMMVLGNRVDLNPDPYANQDYLTFSRNCVDAKFPFMIDSAAANLLLGEVNYARLINDGLIKEAKGQSFPLHLEVLAD